MKVFEISKLSFNIGNTPVLNNINVSLERGKWLLIAGPNGAGKSSLVKVVSGVWKKQKGTVKIWGKELETYTSRELAQKMATLFSNFRPIYNINVYDFIKLGIYAKTGLFEYYFRKNKRDVELAIETTETEDLLDRGIMELSQGELQRVRIAKILAQNPEIMVFDEPLLHLDIKHKIWILELLARLRASGKTIITVIHDFSLSFLYPDTFLLLKKGRIIYSGSQEEKSELIRAFEETFEIKLSLKDNFLLPDRDR